MKKLFTLIAVLGMAAYANAQSFVFTMKGEVLDDNATVEIKAREYLSPYEYKGETFYEWLIDCSTEEDLLLKNNTSSEIPFHATLRTPENETNWGIQWCMGILCNNYSKEDISDEEPAIIDYILAANESMSVKYHVEIEPEMEDYGTMLSTIKVEANGESRTVNIRFVYDETSNSIASVGNGNAVEVARFTVDGRQLTKPQRGLNIVKMSDGSIKKVLVK